VAAKPHAVVIGLDCMTGLQTARILARHGVPMVGLAADLRHFGARTRVCERILHVETASEELIRCLEWLGPSLTRPAVLYPCTDQSVLLLSRHRDRLSPWYHVVLPAHEVVEMLMDKVSFYTHADGAGLPIPATRILTDRADAERAARELTYPSILKPPLRSATWETNASVKVIKVSDAQELLSVYDRVMGWADTLLVQEWVEGGDDALYSCNCYFDADSRPLVTFVARKLRQWPPHTGTSALGEECRNDEVLAETVRLFSGVGYRGLGYLEMKRDVRTGRHYIIEPNIGRPTGRSAIAEGGGVELLYTMYCDVLGLPMPTNTEQRYVGTKWVDLRRDCQSAVYYWRRGELSAAEWRRSLRGPKAHALLSADDPLPFIVDLLHSASKAVRRRGQVAARASGVVEPTRSG
jgi:predicted ATP-grasp superfamily ATP-dependent carboligase